MKIKHVEVRYGEKRRKGALHVGFGGTHVGVNKALLVCEEAVRKTFGDKELGDEPKSLPPKDLG